MIEGGSSDLDLQLAHGGPFYALEERLGLIRHPGWKLLLLVALGWLPPALLSLMRGAISGGDDLTSFLNTYALHARSLLAVAMLLVAEPVVEARVTRAVPRLAGRLPPEARAVFERMLRSTKSLRNTWLVEGPLVVLAYALAILPRLGRIRADSSWYASGGSLTAAGWSYALIGLPLFLFLFLRWVWRFGLWSALLSRVSRMPLQLEATNPDRAAGLGFLGETQATFGWLISAAAVVVAGVWADRIAWDGVDPRAFQVPLMILVIALPALLLLPLTLFTPHLWKARVRDFDAFDTLASRHGQDFADRWLRGPLPESPLGAPEISSQQDLETSYVSARQTRLVPFGPRIVVILAAAVLAPMLIPVLVSYPITEVARKVMQVVLSIP